MLTKIKMSRNLYTKEINNIYGPSICFETNLKQQPLKQELCILTYNNINLFQNAVKENIKNVITWAKK